MKLDLTVEQFGKWIDAYDFPRNLEGIISSIAYDSRKIVHPEGVVFFALPGELRDGHNFIDDAYKKGVRNFVISKSIGGEHLYPDASFYRVKDVLQALQKLAGNYRRQFTYPLIAIAGSTGKTTVKEWIYHFLSPELKIARSPKSYNSQIGVALSLLELTTDKDLALIEVGTSKPGEMERLQEIIQPDFGVLTSIRTSHLKGFSSSEELLNETLKLFKGTKQIFVPIGLDLSGAEEKSIHLERIAEELLPENVHLDKAGQINARLAYGVSKYFVKNLNSQSPKWASLPKLALRMETFQGINNNTIINDSYNLDFDALQHSLEHQVSVAKGQKRVVLIGLDESMKHEKARLESIVEKYLPDELVFVEKPEDVRNNYENSVILIKGTRKSDMQRVARMFRLKKHKTYVSIDLSALRNNVHVYQQLVGSETDLLAMVKASSYGSGIDKIATFLEACGIKYFGVAYADEGTEMRKLGIKTPILVMNAEEEGFEDCLANQLEPAIYSFEQLDAFITECIFQGVMHYPIHIKVETGMKRLGFDPKDLNRLAEILNAQPEVKVKSVYSHLADADNQLDNSFTKEQIASFNSALDVLKNALPYPFTSHLLNSEGMANYPGQNYSMARLGIGMFGVSSNPSVKKQLKPVISWKSSVSQIKTISKGESIGYSRSFKAEKDMEIAIIPVGYADGFRRSLSNGKGGVYIGEDYCPTVARVCMDMIMVDVSEISVKIGQEVEIIGIHQSIDDLAQKMDTIAYEVMTGISKRVARVYLE